MDIRDIFFQKMDVMIFINRTAGTEMCFKRKERKSQMWKWQLSKAESARYNKQVKAMKGRVALFHHERESDSWWKSVWKWQSEDGPGADHVNSERGTDEPLSWSKRSALQQAR